MKFSEKVVFKNSYDEENFVGLKYKKDKIYIYELVADLMGNPIISHVMYSDWIYIYLINQLEEKGIIKSFIIDDKKYIELNK